MPADPPPSQPAPTSTRRSSERLSVGFDVRLARDEAGELVTDLEAHLSQVSEHNFYQGFSENLSDGGLFVQTYQARTIGDRVTLQFTLPDDDTPVVVRGVVRWVRAFHEPSGTKPGVGVQFEGLSPEAQQRIERFLRHRSPLFYDE